MDYPKFQIPNSTDNKDWTIAELKHTVAELKQKVTELKHNVNLTLIDIEKEIYMMYRLKALMEQNGTATGRIHLVFASLNAIKIAIKIRFRNYL